MRVRRGCVSELKAVTSTFASAAWASVLVPAKRAVLGKDVSCERPHGHAKTIGLMCGASRERLRNCASEWCAFLWPDVQPWMKRSASAGLRCQPRTDSIGSGRWHATVASWSSCSS